MQQCRFTRISSRIAGQIIALKVHICSNIESVGNLIPRQPRKESCISARLALQPRNDVGARRHLGPQILLVPKNYTVLVHVLRYNRSAADLLLAKIISELD